ncbi:zinc transporter ZupT [Micrococcus sp. FDAARGOS_333]|uniref:zinc transporter ZupT n=1 Tax=Micrococcus sp. FDAARGOS_333 TaxID=1930558 RepID=UPI000C9E33CD|nr:zinc transporter ZupT [Micrococcus sp. FDAARGOS_333]PNL18332.1 zinc transporter ZupT [Micrococcus sp. FDAARGOS_333]
MPPSDPVLTALGLTVFAGVTTVLGGVLAVMGRTPGPRGLALGLGLAGGVMVSVSFMEIIPEATDGLVPDFGTWAGTLMLVGFLAGVGSFLAIDRFLPDRIDLDEREDGAPVTRRDRRMMRLGLVTAVGIGLHNLPEGFATFAATLSDPKVGLALAVAMAIHNVPEGLAVAVPVRQATGSRRKALGWAALTGIAEPVGALVGYLLLAPILTEALLSMLFAAVAGIMVVISVDKLLPAAREAGGARVSLAGMLIGMVAMMVSLDMLP